MSPDPISLRPPVARQVVRPKEPVKDRKMHNGANTPFGEGETPIVEVLRLIRDNKWKIQATIEFEYKVPAGSDRMAELARTVKYCRDALV